MNKKLINEVLDEGFEETGTIEGAFGYLIKWWLRDLFNMNNWDEPKTRSKIIKYKNKKYQIDIMEDGCCEVTNNHRIMYWKHTVKEI